jgi:hypothetical protein
MSFLNLAFLWGLPLLAVPVAIHLLSRRRQDVVKWGAMQFLLESSLRRRKIWRVDDLLLMLLRTLAVVALVLALARPLWHGSSLGGAGHRDVIFVWDVSMSMGRALKDGTPFDRLLEKTEELLEKLGPTDSLRGMITVGRGEWLTTESEPATAERKQQLLGVLKETGVTEASADWFACLGTALRVAAPARSRARLVVVLCDGQAQGWRKEDQPGWQNFLTMVEESKTPTAIELHNVVGAVDLANNLAIDKLSTPRPLLGIGETFVVEADVRNHGDTPLERGTIQWSLDGTSLGQSTVGPIGVGQSIKVPLKQVAGKSGVSRLTCRLETPDDLAADNECSLILEVIEHVPILLVDDAEEEDPLKSDRGYVLAALGQDKTGASTPQGTSIFDVTTIASTELGAQALSNFRAIIFSNTPDLDEAAIGKLTEFVRVGGGLWLALGDRTSPQEFNRQLYRSGAGLAPWPIETAQGDPDRREKFVAIHPPLKEHPATVLLADTQRLDIDRAKVFRRFPFAAAPARGQIPVLLESGTGEALAVEGFLGQGRVIVQALSMGVRWSNLPLMQAYVPLVHEWLWHLIQPTGIALNLRPGDPLLVSLPPNEHVRAVRLKQPGGIELPLTTIQQGARSLAQSRRTQRPGLYEAVIEVEGKPDDVRPYQVARSPEESKLDQWPVELTAKWNDSRIARVNPTESIAMPASTFGQTTGEPLWGMLLALVVFALLAELGMARRIAAKRFGFRNEAAENQSPAFGRFAAFLETAVFGRKGGPG